VTEKTSSKERCVRGRRRYLRSKGTVYILKQSRAGYPYNIRSQSYMYIATSIIEYMLIDSHRRDSSILEITALAIQIVDVVFKRQISKHLWSRISNRPYLDIVTLSDRIMASSLPQRRYSASTL
jgi:hypothetical protein